MENKFMGGFEDLVVWQEARKYSIIIRKLTLTFPGEEKFRLSDQLIRSSRSITANIAEGHGRFHYQENIQFCRMARGSLLETLDHLICARDCGYINEQTLEDFRTHNKLVHKLLNGYIAYLKSRKKED